MFRIKLHHNSYTFLLYCKMLTAMSRDSILPYPQFKYKSLILK
nr:MAG TPA: hypothetical protein [Caudoviricetes sp.]